MKKNILQVLDVNWNDILDASLNRWNDWKWHMKQKSICGNIKELTKLGILKPGFSQGKMIGMTPYNIKRLLDLKEVDPEAYKAEWLQSFLRSTGKKKKHQWSWARRHDLKISKFFESIPLPKWIKTLFLGRGSDTDIQALENMYPETDILIATSACARHCSFCFREVGDSQGEAAQLTGNMDTVLHAVDKIIERGKPHVLITGGDPLTRSNEQLEKILAPLVNSSSIKVIRLATRMVVDLPMRFYDDNLLAMLKKHALKMKERGASLRIVTHIDHPSELTQEAIQAVQNIQACGIEIMNQTAVFRGVNDDALILKELLMKADRLGIRNHKLFHSMPVEGTNYLRIPFRKFERLVSSLHQWLPGTSVPQANVVTLVGKMPVSPRGRWIMPIPFLKWLLVRSFRGEWFLFKDTWDIWRHAREVGIVLAMGLLLFLFLGKTSDNQVPRESIKSIDKVVITKVVKIADMDSPDYCMRQPFEPYVTTEGILIIPLGGLDMKK